MATEGPPLSTATAEWKAPVASVFIPGTYKIPDSKLSQAEIEKQEIIMAIENLPLGWLGYEQGYVSERSKVAAHEKKHIDALGTSNVIWWSTLPKGDSLGRTIPRQGVPEGEFIIAAAAGSLDTVFGKAQGYQGDFSQIIFADWKSGRSGGVSIPLARMEAQNRVSKKNPDADLEARVCLLMAKVGEGPGWLIEEIEARARIELKAEKLGLTYLLEGKQFTEKPKFKEIEELPANYIIIKVYPDGRAIEEIYIDNELKKRKCLVCHAEAGAGHNCRKKKSHQVFPIPGYLL